MAGPFKINHMGAISCHQQVCNDRSMLSFLGISTNRILDVHTQSFGRQCL